MRLKTFMAPSLPEAMARVREALGPDAIILSNQPGENGTGVRVTAALETAIRDETDFGLALDGAQSFDAISEALDYHRAPAELFDRLIGSAATLPTSDAVQALAGALDAELGFAPLPPPDTARPIMLVGPPGAGKTATAAKLCARARLAGAEACVITMDTVKSGGLAQVTTFAEALGAHLVQAEDDAALAAAVDACPADHVVVVDTVGANPFDDGDIARLKRAATAAGTAVTLVLPAGGDAADCADAAAAFARAGARSLIATRLDTARRLGGLLSAAHAGKLALTAASDSPHIANPLLTLDRMALARLLLPSDPGADQDAPPMEAQS